MEELIRKIKLLEKDSSQEDEVFELKYRLMEVYKKENLCNTYLSPSGKNEYIKKRIKNLCRVLETIRCKDVFKNEMKGDAQFDIFLCTHIYLPMNIIEDYIKKESSL